MKSNILIFISLFISSLSVKPIYPEPYDIISHYTLNEPLLQGPNSGNKIKTTKISQKITFFEDGEENIIIFTLKAINLPKGYQITSYRMKFPNKGTITNYNALFRKKVGKYILRKDEFTFMFKLFNNEEIDIKLKFKTKNSNIFKLYRCEYISLPISNFGIPGTISVKGSEKVAIIGTKLGHLKNNKESNTYYWKGIVKSKKIFDYVFIGYKTARWIGSVKGIIKSNKNSNLNENVEFHIFPYFLGGNNKIHKYDVLSNNSKNIDDRNNIQKDNKIIFKSNMRKKYAFFKIESTFSNYISPKWKLRTTLSNQHKLNDKNFFRNKAKEIISKDKSNSPNYIKLGRWVNKNMKYDIKYLGKKMSPEEILNKLIGVCEHYTILYNALLNSIGIKTIYTTGYAYNSKEKLLNNPLDNYHAWTIAKIDNKWIPLDSTWGIFEGKLPLSHVFDTFIQSNVTYNTCDGCDFKREHQIQFLGYDEENDEMK